MNKVQLFQERILTDAEQLALATGAAAYRWEDLTKTPVSPCMLLNPRRYGDEAKDLWTTLNCVQENIIRGGQHDRSRRRPDGSRMPKSRAINGVDEDMKLNVDPAAATETSLAENTIRVAMHPADRFIAFHDLVLQTGLGIEMMWLRASVFLLCSFGNA